MANEDVYTVRQQDRAIDTTILFLREFFKESTEFTYDDDPRQSLIRIDGIYSVRKEDVEKFPALIVRRLPHRWQHRTMDRLQYLKFTNGEKGQLDFVNGGLVVQCISTQGLEAEQLASIVFHALVMFKVDFFNNGIFEIDAVELGDEQPAVVTAIPEVVMVPVTVNYMYPIQWKRTYRTSVAFGNFTIRMRVNASPITTPPVSDLVVEIVDPIE